MKLEVEPPSTNARAGPTCGDWGSAGDEYLCFPSDGFVYNAFGSTARKNSIDPDVTTAVTLTSWNVEEIRTAASSYIYLINAVEKRNTGTNTVGWGSAPKIGRSATSSKNLVGMIAEVIMYNKILNDATERKAVVHTYLNTKYGFSLPT
jgi:hypothetical protein